MSRKELTKIRKIMTNIENSELHIVENATLHKVIYDDMEEYININQKIILNGNNVMYTNEYIEELDKSIEEISQKYLK